VAPGASEVGAACGSGAYAASDAALDRIEVGRAPGGEWPGQAYVVAMRGCDNFCAYCVVPYVRGPERSRRPDVILEEARRLVGGGVREITLLGQAVNRYRAESGGRTWDLADLLAAVAAVPDLARLRFVTSHPGAMTPRLALAFRDVPRLMPHLHMPAQSGSDAVLARMNRGYTAAEYAARVAMVREAAPGVAVVSDFIVGFPGETEADFEATLDLARRMRFAAAFVFKYSPRPGTAAARQFPDDVPADQKRRRHQALSEAIAAIAAEENRQFVGRRVRVLVEGASPRPNPSAAGRRLRPGWGQLRGRTPCHRLVVLDGPPELIGREVEAEVVEAGAVTMFGRIPEE
jgi:tRNA-2-methylthio-N6-dimethylallyladenosine synthase